MIKLCLTDLFLYLPPFILFCEAIVGRMMPPRVAGASGSESLWKVSNKLSLTRPCRIIWRKVLFYLLHDLTFRLMHCGCPFHALTFYLIVYYFAWLQLGLNWCFVGCLQSAYMNANFETWNLRIVKKTRERKKSNTKQLEILKLVCVTLTSSIEMSAAKKFISSAWIL